MISVDDALSIVRSHRVELQTERVELMRSLGRVLANDIRTPVPLPLFDNSAMDGYAVGDERGPWRMIGEVAAGESSGGTVGAREAVRIFTGAHIPQNTYAVIPQEEATLNNGEISGITREGANIRRCGEELRVGMMVSAAGTRVTPPLLAAMASMGFALLEVIAKIHVAVISTGNELVTPGSPLLPGQIYDSNATAMVSALTCWGNHAESHSARDSKEELSAKIASVIPSCEILITTGGVSVGAYDYVLAAVQSQGFEVHFHGVAMKPGKPIAFGSRGDGKLWFGLPGNPLSAWTGLLLFVAESLGHSLSSSWRPLSHEVKRKAGREEFIPCTWDEDGKAGLIDTVGSHSNMALVGADGLARIPAKQEYMAVGSPVQTYRFPWSNAA